MVHVKVKDEHLAQPVRGLRVARGGGDGAEE
jgi:hypothetical protein